jgi:hypothetical protein
MLTRLQTLGTMRRQSSVLWKPRWWRKTSWRKLFSFTFGYSKLSSSFWIKSDHGALHTLWVLVPLVLYCRVQS